jgi:hypothetical protein
MLCGRQEKAAARRVSYDPRHPPCPYRASARHGCTPSASFAIVTWSGQTAELGAPEAQILRSFSGNPAGDEVDLRIGQRGAYFCLSERM